MSGMVRLYALLSPVIAEEGMVFPDQEHNPVHMLIKYGCSIGSR